MFMAAIGATYDNDTVQLGEYLDLFHPDANPLGVGDPLLIHAVLQKSHAAAKLLLERGANIYSTTDLGDNALHMVSKWGDLKMAQLLLAHQKNLDVLAQEDFTAINYAMAFRNYDIANALYRAGASVDIADSTFHLTARERAAQAKFKLE